MSTQRTILFLGAGASKALGYPLTVEIFERILGGLKARSLFPSHNVIYPLQGEHHNVNEFGFIPGAMDVFERELVELFPGILINPNPPLITEVISLLDHLIFTGNSALPRYPQERLVRLRALLERA